MRTYEDVKLALKHYHDELANEASAKLPHYVVVGGNMCIIKKGASTQYILGKGSPVPMIKTTAESNLKKFQDKCGDNIKLEMIVYSDWLNDEIKECNHLIGCMQKSLSGEEPEQPIQMGQEEVHQGEPTGPGSDVHSRCITMSCTSCPYGINTCMTCRFAVGIRMQVIPWEIICNAPVSAELSIEPSHDL